MTAREDRELMTMKNCRGQMSVTLGPSSRKGAAMDSYIWTQSSCSSTTLQLFSKHYQQLNIKNRFVCSCLAIILTDMSIIGNIYGSPFT